MKLPEDEIDDLAEIWCDPDKDINLGEFIQLVADRTIQLKALSEIHKMEERLRGVYI